MILFMTVYFNSTQSESHIFLGSLNPNVSSFSLKIRDRSSKNVFY